jgi:hypothetical protein
MSAEIDYRAVRQRVEAGVKKQKMMARVICFVVSLVMFILFLVIAWSMYVGNTGVAGNTDATTGAMIMLSAGWGSSVLFQFVLLLFDTKIGEQSIRERVTGRELGRELLNLGEEEPDEKRKQMMRLTDDGELEAVPSEDATPELARRQVR